MLWTVVLVVLLAGEPTEFRFATDAEVCLALDSTSLGTIQSPEGEIHYPIAGWCEPPDPCGCELEATS